MIFSDFGDFTGIILGRIVRQDGGSFTTDAIGAPARGQAKTFQDLVDQAKEHAA